MANFLNSNERGSAAVADALRTGLRNGVGDYTVGAIMKAQRTPMRLGDGLLKRNFVSERINDPSVDAIRKCLASPRRETGDTLTKMMKGLTGPDIMNVTLPGQSTNALDTGASASRAGAVSGVVDRLPVEQTVSVFGARSSSAIGSRSAGPEDSDVERKRKGRRLAIEPDCADPLDTPDMARSRRVSKDECTEAIKLAHARGSVPMFQR
jgi:hypothetical protein